MQKEKSKEAFAVAVIDKTTSVERDALVDWLQSLLEIRSLPASKKEKTLRAIKITKDKKVIFPIIKKNISHVKR